MSTPELGKVPLQHGREAAMFQMWGHGGTRSALVQHRCSLAVHLLYQHKVCQSHRQRLDLSCITMEHGTSGKSKAEFLLHATPRRQSLEARGHPLDRPESPACSAPATSSGGPQQLAFPGLQGAPSSAVPPEGMGGACWQEHLWFLFEASKRYFWRYKRYLPQGTFLLTKRTLRRPVLHFAGTQCQSVLHLLKPPHLSKRKPRCKYSYKTQH